MSLKELYIRVCKLIEEYTGTNITDDEDIRSKLPVLTNQGIKKILQVKPILKFAELEYGSASSFGAYFLFPCPDDMYKLRNVDTGGAEYWQTANGNKNYIKVRGGYYRSIFIEYEAFHTEINAETPIDAADNEQIIIELTAECFPVLENFVCAGLTTDSPEMYGHFFAEYQSGLQSLTEGRQKRLIQIDILEEMPSRDVWHDTGGGNNGGGDNTGGGGDSDMFWKPNVNSNGDISWTLSSSTMPPATQNIKGPQGSAGATGQQGQPGAQGSQGAAGYTPVRGTDYWTAADVQTIQGYVDLQIGGAINGSY